MSEDCLSTCSSNSGPECGKRKIELCRAYVESGFCRYGEACFFAHGTQELLISAPMLKSKICRNFQKDHHCRYGDRCNFKHETTPKKGAVRLTKALVEYPQIITMLMAKKRQTQITARQGCFSG